MRTGFGFGLGVVLLAACNNEQTPEWRTPDAIFPLLESHYPTRIAAAPENPQLVRHLIMQQRQLFTILTGNQPGP
jgi:hypothetical protein